MGKRGAALGDGLTLVVIWLTGGLDVVSNLMQVVSSDVAPTITAVDDAASDPVPSLMIVENHRLSALRDVAIHCRIAWSRVRKDGFLIELGEIENMPSFASEDGWEGALATG